MRRSLFTAMLGLTLGVTTVSACGVTFQPTKQAAQRDYLNEVKPYIIATDFWTDADLLKAGRGICRELNSTNGDPKAVAQMVMAGMSPTDNQEQMRIWTHDVASIEAGAVDHLCPQWKNVWN